MRIPNTSGCVSRNQATRVVGNIALNYEEALGWIKKNTLPEQGIIISSKQRVPYLEVTGYLIPTLVAAGELSLAEQYAEFLSYMQRGNGAFAGADGKEYVFDTGQVLRGLLAATQQWDRYRPFAQKAADYIVSCVAPDGRISAHYEYEIPEAIHVYVLWPLVEASRILGKPEYRQAAGKVLAHYKGREDALRDTCLTHFLAYILDGFIEMGETEFVAGSVRKLFASQRRDGSVPAMPDVRWTCTVGLAQLAIIGYKLNMREPADRAMDYLCRIQNRSGGFHGSAGWKGEYFPREEISWANKFFLDAIQLKTRANQTPGTRVNPLVLEAAQANRSGPLSSREWAGAIVARESVDDLAANIRHSLFPVWCKPLLQRTSPGDSVLELGSGTGQLSAILALHGRPALLLDYSQESFDFARQLFDKLDLKGQFHYADILAGIPLGSDSVDWVFSSGLLEHFTDEQVVAILRDCARVCRKGVMSLVPNGNAILYRAGKARMEKEGKWPYGREMPKLTMREYYEKAGLGNIEECSAGTYHALKFYGEDTGWVREFLDGLSLSEVRNLNQGYLLFTCGKKDQVDRL